MKFSKAEWVGIILHGLSAVYFIAVFFMGIPNLSFFYPAVPMVLFLGAVSINFGYILVYGITCLAKVNEFKISFLAFHFNCLIIGGAVLFKLIY